MSDQTKQINTNHGTTPAEFTYGRDDRSNFTVHYNDGQNTISLHSNIAVLGLASTYFDTLVDASSDKCELTARCSETSRKCITLPAREIGAEQITCEQLHAFFDILHDASPIFNGQLTMKSKLGEWRKNLKAGDTVQFAYHSSQYFYRPGPAKHSMDWVVAKLESVEQSRASATYWDPVKNAEVTKSDIILDRLQTFGDDSRVPYSYELSDFLIAQRSAILLANYFDCKQLLQLYHARCTMLHCEAVDRFQSEPLWVLLMLADKCKWTNLVDALVPLLSADKNCDKRPPHLRRTAPIWEDVYQPLSSSVKARLFTSALEDK